MKNILLLSIVTILTLSCSEDEQTCESISNYNYFHLLIEEVELGNRYKLSSGSDGLSDGNEIVDFEDFYMEIYFYNATYAYTGANQTGDLIRISDRLYDCTPMEEGYIQQIEDITFTTNLDYNDELKAGDVINSIIGLNKQDDGTVLSINDYLARTDKPVNYINTFYLNKQPTSSRNISISVEVQLSHGGNFTANALPITFK